MKLIYREKIGNKRILHIGKVKISYKKNKKDLINSYYEQFKSSGYDVERCADKSIKISGEGLIICGKADNTLWTASEVLCRKGYDFSVNMPFIMVDIGFNLGITSLHFAQNENINAIYAFEPFKPTYELGLKNLELNPALSKKIKLFNFGLGNSDRILQFNYNPDLLGSMSTVSDRFGGGAFKAEKAEVKNAYTVLNDIIEKHKENIFIKLDAEGAEFEILPLLDEKGLLKKVNVLIMEYHYNSPKILTNILERNNFFYFYEGSEPVGVIKAVRL